MYLPLKEISAKLGVDHAMLAYESAPWSLYDSASGSTLDASVTMGGTLEDMVVEIQLVHDTPPEGQPTAVQVMLMHITAQTAGNWSPRDLRIRGEDYVGKVPDWEEKACKFFVACVQSIQMNEMPNIDDLLEREFYSGGYYGGGGGGGGTSPKIKPGKLLGMKGRGF